MMFTVNIECARILGVYPTPSISHQVVFRALTLELVKRGHEVVVITPDPVFRDKVPPANLTEIDIGSSYKIMLEAFNDEKTLSTVKRGAIMDIITILKMDPSTMVKLCHGVFDFQEVKDLMADKSQKFDLVLVESLCYSSLIFGQIYKAPTVLFSSFYGTADNFMSVGALSRHPVLHPHVLRYNLRDLSTWEMIQELKIEWDLYLNDKAVEQIENEFLKSKFGVNAPTVHELKDYVELLFSNTHPLFDGNRPVPPSVVHLGALHLNPTKPLPEDLQIYLDNSFRGVIYVSLGTNVRPSMMDRDFLDEFLNAFEALPYDIMWKFDGDNLYRTPKNVRVQKWFPQRDLLGHPNIKLFITQGGLQSTDEAIDAELPMVGVPFLGDQWFNVNKYIELEIGVGVDSRTMTADKLVKAALKVIGDDTYKKNIAKLRAMMRDQPERPLDRAVWWTEYVIRHGRSKRLLPSYALISWWEYLMVDAVVFIALGVGTATVVAVIAMCYVLRLLSFVNDKFKVKQA